MSWRTRYEQKPRCDSARSEIGGTSMSRHRMESGGEVWWVGYDQASGSYFAGRDEDLDRDDFVAPYLPRFADVEQVIAGKLTLSDELRDQLAAEEPARIDTVEARAIARTDQVAAEVRDGFSGALDPDLQSIVDLNKLDYPVSATEIRPPAPRNTAEGRGYRLPPELGQANDHGYDR